MQTFDRWLRFNAVGAVGIIVQVVALTLLQRAAGLHYLVATALAVQLTVLHNFVWHERWTWRDRQTERSAALWRRLLTFNLTTGAVSIGGNLVGMRVFVGQLMLPPYLGNLATIAACSLANFAVAELLVFGRRSSVL